MAQANREAREQRETFPPKEQYLKEFDQWIEQVHDGIAPEAKYEGTGYDGKEQRKEICEDVSLRDDDAGLFAVMDGVSTAGGWFASRETARVLHEHLGNSLDERLDELVAKLEQNDGVTQKMINQLVMAEIKSSLEAADRRVKLAGQLRPREYAHSATTAVVGKLVEMRGASGETIQRLYFANVGDSPLFIKRTNGDVEQVTVNHDGITAIREMGGITKEEEQKIRNAENPRELPENLRRVASKGNRITRSIGIGQTVQETEVFFVDLNAGDQLIMTSDGVSDQFTESTLDTMLKSDISDTKLEKQLQEQALESSKAGKRVNPRSKKDDIAAVAHTVQEKGPRTRRKEQEQRSVTESQLVDTETVRSWERALKHQEQALAQQRVEYKQLIDGAEQVDPVERIRKEKQIALLEQKVATQKYHIEKAGLDKLDTELPPRFHQGDAVRVWRDDLDPPSLDREPWSIAGYSDHTREYLVQNRAGQEMSVNRYTLERKQPEAMPQKGDVISAEFGAMREPGFTVAAVGRTKVRLEKEDAKTVKAHEVSLPVAQQSYQSKLFAAERSQQRMHRYAEQYHSAARALEDLVDKEQVLVQRKAKERASAQEQSGSSERDQQIQRLDRLIQRAQAMLDRYAELKTKEDSFKTLTSTEQAEYRKLKLRVYGNRNEPPLAQMLQELKQERSEL